MDSLIATDNIGGHNAWKGRDAGQNIAMKLCPNHGIDGVIAHAQGAHDWLAFELQALKLWAQQRDEAAQGNVQA